MEKVRIYLADWQVLFREGVHLTLSGEEDFEVVGEADSNEEAFGFIENNSPEIAIMNVGGDTSGDIDTIRHIIQNFPSVALVALLDNYSGEQFFTVLKSGVDACITKNIGPDELLDTVRKVAKGEHPISQGISLPGISSRIIEEFEEFSRLSEETGNLLARLLPAEIKILRHISDNDSSEEMIKEMDITDQMLGQHLERIQAKLVTNDRNREVINAIKGNLTSVLNKISEDAPASEPMVDYITRFEFDSFKESMLERFNSS